MVDTELLLSVIALLLALCVWFLRRLVGSFDTFKTNVYATLREYGLELARIEERHRIEDGGVIHLHRRANDP